MRSDTRARACDGKQKHPTRQQALAHRRSLIAQGAAATALVAYKCRHCQQWHVGHVMRRKRNA